MVPRCRGSPPFDLPEPIVETVAAALRPYYGATLFPNPATPALSLGNRAAPSNRRICNKTPGRHGYPTVNLERPAGWIGRHVAQQRAYRYGASGAHAETLRRALRILRQEHRPSRQEYLSER